MKIVFKGSSVFFISLANASLAIDKNVLRCGDAGLFLAVKEENE